MTMILYQDEWVTLSLDPAIRLVRYTRSDVPYGSLADMDHSHAGIGQALTKIPPGTKLLLDVRLAPPRNDEAFESKTNAVIEAFLRRFDGYATLVRTAVGKLQTARLARERGSEAHAFDDERAALESLGIGPRAT